MQANRVNSKLEASNSEQKCIPLCPFLVSSGILCISTCSWSLADKARLDFHVLLEPCRQGQTGVPRALGALQTRPEKPQKGRERVKKVEPREGRAEWVAANWG